MKPFKAFRINSIANQINAGIEMLTVEQLSPGDVLIKAVYSSINYKDALAATGKGKILKKFPLVGGIDVAGYVETSTDKRFSPGDQVFVCGEGLSETRDGGYSEFVRVPGDKVIAIPDGLSLFQVMAMGTAGFSAALAIHKLQLNGQTPELGPVLVSGASGGVGSYAIDLLSGLGYEVVAVSSKPQQTDFLHALGATKILSSDALAKSNKPLEKGMWGGAIDNVGGDFLSGLTRTVNPQGNIAVIGLVGGIKIETTVMPFILRGINLLGINSAYYPHALKPQIWHRLANDLKPKHIDKIVTSVVSLEQLPECFEDFIQGRHYGRTVVKISE